MIAAIYTRKSTDQSGVADEQKSVTRQVEHAREYAQRKGWIVADEHVYVDDGISGAEFSNRPGFLRLMNAIKPRAPFQALVMSEASRLGRETFETGYALKQLSQAGVRCFSYLDNREIALDSAIDKFMMSAATFAAEIEREKARQRVADAMERRARAGYVAGGRCFGYENVVITTPDGKRSHVERVIKDDEAAIVREIFEASASGDGFTRIAKRLNAAHTPCPRPNGHGKPLGWAASSVRAILWRPMYRGEPLYNTTKKRDQWGQRKTSDRPERDWIRASVPALRLVSDELWHAAHGRLREIRTQLGTAGRRRVHDVEGKYLLSGFARCTMCGGSVYAIPKGGGEGQSVYGCSAYHRRGASVCSNHLRLPVGVVDQAVLGTLANNVLRPREIMAIVDGVLEGRRPERRAADAAAVRAELQHVDGELARLTDAIATGGELRVLLQAIQVRQARRDELVAMLAARQTWDRQRVDRQAIEADVHARLRDQRALLADASHTERRQLLREMLVGPLRFTPDGRTYRFEGDAAIGRLLSGVAGLQHLWCARRDVPNAAHAHFVGIAA